MRSPLTFSEKIGVLTVYASTFSFFLVTGAIGAFYSIIEAKKQRNFSLLLPIWIYVINTFVLTILPISLLHYFLSLTPYLIFLSAKTFQRIGNLLTRFKGLRIATWSAWKMLMISLLIILMGFTLFQTITSLFPHIEFSYNNPYTEVEGNIGTYVSRITSYDDTIWTSEPGIAFFAQRIIIAPNSSSWPFHGFFYDVFNTTYDGHKGLGIVSPDQFIEAWEKQKVKVIIFIRGNGWVPYPDEVLWTGFASQRGVADYVKRNYLMINVIKSLEIPYTYEIWVRT
jgi:hypothetical protein